MCRNWYKKPWVFIPMKIGILYTVIRPMKVFQIGEDNEPLKPYLNIDAIIAVAKNNNVDAITSWLWIFV